MSFYLAVRGTLPFISKDVIMVRLCGDDAAL